MQLTSQNKQCSISTASRDWLKPTSQVPGAVVGQEAAGAGR